jgi:hypothetical protein
MRNAAGNETLLGIKLTKRSDIHKYSICNLQFSISTRPGQGIRNQRPPAEMEVRGWPLEVAGVTSAGGR